MRSLLSIHLATLFCSCTMVHAGPAWVNIEIPQTPVAIKGSLISSEGARLPLIIVIPGSGPGDRDGTIKGVSGPAVYKLLAEKLAPHGFAVFTYDKRWITKPELATTFTEEDHLSDVQAIISYFITNSATDAKRIFLFGLSEGGTIAAVAASRSKALAGVVIASSACFPIDELLLEQTKGNPILNGEIRSILSAMRDGTFPQGGVMMGASKEYWMQWISFTTNLSSIISQVHCPILVLQGLKDETLPGDTLKRNITAWSAITKEYPRVKLNTYDNVTHTLFESGKNDTSDRVVEEVSDWLDHQSNKKAPHL